MAEIRNLERDLHHFRGRLIAAGAFVLLCFALLGARLVWLQVFRHDELMLQAEANRIAVVPVVDTKSCRAASGTLHVSVVLPAMLRPSASSGAPSVVVTNTTLRADIPPPVIGSRHDDGASSPSGTPLRRAWPVCVH
jgi:hypothetical protein